MIIDMKVILGGVLLGLAAGIMLLVRGQILGCSGKLFRSWDFAGFKPNYDNLLFIAGLVLSGIIFNLTQQIPNPLAVFKISPWMLFAGGLLVGGGTYLANGCTSGHGLCGMSLLRKRSITAVAIFFPVAIITAWLVH
ncbi:transmembrane protein [Legionella moravica]|uniref:Transmembrane protein n=1 Tax=Legionella moravica TaxID=39962 RepID=A0A378JXQ1_9GAMM|nr:membrane protein [Legionella moravica]KTD33437.1 transmembrane protein [Legionella moravica]STX61809.1 transmembrane protein [Legionella moravica]